MNLTYPHYYKNFKCIGSACTDNCCIGWEIDIDTATLSFYKGVGGSFGKELEKNISTESEPHFILKNQRCPFLNSSNLCDIIINLGEDKLCEICTKHPRFYEWFSDVTEVGIGMCCEEACRLILESPQKATFITEKSTNSTAPTTDNKYVKPLFYARTKAIDILQNRIFTISQRIILFVSMCEKVQNQLDNNSIDEIYSIADSFGDINLLHKILNETTINTKTTFNNFKELIRIYKSMEVIDKAWKTTLSELESNINFITDKKNQFLSYYSDRMYQYEQLLVYYVYRYFMKSAFDCDLLGKAHFAIAGYIVTGMLDTYKWAKNNGKLTLADKVSIAKAYSKEVEYSQINIDILADESVENPLFLTENLLSII